MNLSQLQKFLAVARSRTLTEAAERLCTTQPNLSNALRALEEEIGVPLFDRVRGRLILNAAGRAAARRAEEALEAAEKLKAEARAAAEQGRFLRAGFCDPGPMWYALPLAAGMPGMLPVKPFVEDIPAASAAELRSRRGAGELHGEDPSRRALLRRLADGEIDFAVVSSPGPAAEDGAPSASPAPAGIRIEPFLEDRLCLSLPPDHPLAASSEPIALADAAPLSLYLLLVEGAGERQFYPFLASVPGVEIECERDFFLYLPELKRRGAAATTTRIVRHYRQDGPARVFRPLADPAAFLRYELAVREDEAERLARVFAWRDGVRRALELAEAAY